MDGHAVFRPHKSTRLGVSLTDDPPWTVVSGYVAGKPTKARELEDAQSLWI